MAAERNAALAQIEKLTAAQKERFEEIAFLTRTVETLIEERDALLSDLNNGPGSGKKQLMGIFRRHGPLLLIRAIAFGLRVR